MLQVSCLCGRVGVRLATRPDHVNECNCTLCTRSGARWAYVHPSEATITGDTASYSREDKDDPAAELHFCPRCGTVTHFVLTPSALAKFGNGMMGVNLRLADERDLAGVELRFPDGRAWSGAGDFTYAREAEVIGG